MKIRNRRGVTGDQVRAACQWPAVPLRAAWDDHPDYGRRLIVFARDEQGRLLKVRGRTPCRRASSSTGMCSLVGQFGRRSALLDVMALTPFAVRLAHLLTCDRSPAYPRAVPLRARSGGELWGAAGNRDHADQERHAATSAESVASAESVSGPGPAPSTVGAASLRDSSRWA